MAQTSENVNSGSRNPLKSGSVVISIIGFWFFYFAIFSLRALLLDLPDQFDLALKRAIVMLLGILVTLIFWQIILSVQKKSLRVRMITAALVAMPTAVILSMINYFVFNIFGGASGCCDLNTQEVFDAHWLVDEISNSSPTNYFLLIAWAALYLALGYARDVVDSERRAAQFSKAAKEAEIRALRYQVNPHFLFNTLNSLSALVITNRAKEADKMILNLSDFLRTSLSEDPTLDVPLSDEITAQRLYLDVESVRFPDRLVVTTHLPDDLADVPVPGLILQPLVENAIKYGVATTKDKVEIMIIAVSVKSERGEHVKISVINDRSGTGPAGTSHGIGLTNVTNRLAARYGAAAKFETRTLPQGGFEAAILIEKEAL
jgi:two-component system, LytTR family, sensor kinase